MNDRIYKFTLENGCNEMTSGVKSWYGICCNDEGDKIYGLIYGNKIYGSQDGGNSWSELLTLKNCNSISCNQDGQKVLVCGWNTKLQISLDGGKTWKEKDIVRKWLNCSISNKHLLAVGYNMEIVYSNDNGENTITLKDEQTRQSTWIVENWDRNMNILFAGSNYTGYLYKNLNNIEKQIQPISYTCSILVTDGNYSPKLTFTDCHISSEDNSIIACDSTNYSPVYISKDEGQTWTTFQESKTWSCVYMTYGLICVGESSGKMYYTTDGKNWVKKLPEQNWKFIKSSQDNTKIYCVPDMGNIFITNSSGKSWTMKQIGNWEEWSGICCSKTGNQVYLCSKGGKIFSSGDSGVSWKLVYINPQEKWKGIDCTMDGQIIWGLSDKGNIFISSNYGNKWDKYSNLLGTNDSNSFLENCNNLVCTYDGQKLYVSVSDDHIYFSKDGGQTWNKTDNKKKWFRGSINKNTGNYVVSSPGYLCLIDGTSFKVTEVQINNIC